MNSSLTLDHEQFMKEMNFLDMDNSYETISFGYTVAKKYHADEKNFKYRCATTLTMNQN